MLIDQRTHSTDDLECIGNETASGYFLQSLKIVEEIDEERLVLVKSLYGVNARLEFND